MTCWATFKHLAWFSSTTSDNQSARRYFKGTCASASRYLWLRGAIGSFTLYHLSLEKAFHWGFRVSVLLIQKWQLLFSNVCLHLLILLVKTKWIDWIYLGKVVKIFFFSVLLSFFGLVKPVMCLGWEGLHFPECFAFTSETDVPLKGRWHFIEPAYKLTKSASVTHEMNTSWSLFIDVNVACCHVHGNTSQWCLSPATVATLIFNLLPWNLCCHIF